MLKMVVKDEHVERKDRFKTREMGLKILVEDEHMEREGTFETREIGC
jgi:hypothetical protein